MWGFDAFVKKLHHKPWKISDGSASLTKLKCGLHQRHAVLNGPRHFMIGPPIQSAHAVRSASHCTQGSDKWQIRERLIQKLFESKHSHLHFSHGDELKLCSWDGEVRDANIHSTRVDGFFYLAWQQLMDLKSDVPDLLRDECAQKIGREHFKGADFQWRIFQRGPVIAITFEGFD